MNSDFRQTDVCIGLVSIGLEAYWKQFSGLKERLIAFSTSIGDRLRRPNVEVIDAGLVDTPEKAIAAGKQFRRQDVDLIFLTVST